MKRAVFCVLSVAVAVGSVAGFGLGRAQAYPEFKKEFDQKYVPEDPTTPEQKSLKEHAGAAKCGICHTGPQGKDKKKRNAYGQAIGKLVKKADKKMPAKIQAALDSVENEHSDPANPASPTFGDLLKKGELPVPAK